MKSFISVSLLRCIKKSLCYLLMFLSPFGIGIKAGFLLPSKIDSISIQFIEYFFLLIIWLGYHPLPG